MLQCIFICDKCRQEDVVSPDEAMRKQYDHLELCDPCNEKLDAIRNKVDAYWKCAFEAFKSNAPPPIMEELW